MFEFPQPDHMPCPECGASVPRECGDEHVCDEQRRLDFMLAQHRDELAEFDDQLAAWFESPEGRFAVWRAEQDRH